MVSRRSSADTTPSPSRSWTWNINLSLSSAVARRLKTDRMRENSIKFTPEKKRVSRVHSGLIDTSGMLRNSSRDRKPFRPRSRRLKRM